MGKTPWSDSHNDMNRRINTQCVAKWASLGRQLRSANQKAVPSWLSVQKLIDATQPILQENRNEARRLLEASNHIFAPLKDPFETSLGLHRWLSGEREEAYSDWLAWIIEELATPESISSYSAVKGPLSLYQNVRVHYQFTERPFSKPPKASEGQTLRSVSARKGPFSRS